MIKENLRKGDKVRVLNDFAREELGNHAIILSIDNSDDDLPYFIKSTINNGKAGWADGKDLILIQKIEPNHAPPPVF